MIVPQEKVLSRLGLDPDKIRPDDLDTINDLHVEVERLIKDFVGFEIERQTFTTYLPQIAAQYDSEPLVEGYEMQGGLVVPYGSFSNSSQYLNLPNVPVRSIIGVWENPAAWRAGGATPDFPDSSLIDPDSYQIDFAEGGLGWSGQITRLTGFWPTLPRTLKITYEAGLIQSEINGRYVNFRMAVLTAIMTWWNTVLQQRVSQKSGAVGGALIAERLADWQVTYDGPSQRMNAGLFNKLPRAVLSMLEEYVLPSKYLPYG